uniref:Bifunctional inhibitor/plant lipid transfer protein/seed storage helical domain-containing protein n=1 Tax=Populus trichocarpa TaxID=3694 RepID=A0A2K1YAL5_POPTR
MLWARPMARLDCTNVLVTMSQCYTQLANVVGSSPQCLCQVLNDSGSSLRINQHSLPNARPLQEPTESNDPKPPKWTKSEAIPHPINSLMISPFPSDLVGGGCDGGDVKVVKVVYSATRLRR